MGVDVDVDFGDAVSSAADAVVWVPVDDSSEEGEELSKTIPFIVATEARAASVRLYLSNCESDVDEDCSVSESNSSDCLVKEDRRVLLLLFPLLATSLKDTSSF